MKICKICRKEQPLNSFYGVQTECKTCTKERVKLREQELRKNPEWVEKEKARAREKYHRLGYKDKHNPGYIEKKKIMGNYTEKYPEKKKAKNLSQRIKPITKGNQMHHWSYQLVHAKNVIELSVKNHQKLHRYLIYDQSNFMYKRIDTGELLDTREKHEAYMFDVLANKPD